MVCEEKYIFFLDSNPIFPSSFYNSISGKCKKKVVNMHTLTTTLPLLILTLLMKRKKKENIQCIILS